MASSAINYAPSPNARAPRTQKKPDEVAAFVATLAQQLAEQAALAAPRGYTQVKVFAQDESRVGLRPIVRRRITARGVQPVCGVAYRFDNFYLYGAVAPLSGESFFLELPYLNAAMFQLFIDGFCQAFADSFNLWILDNGAFHKAKVLRRRDNLVCIFLPAYAPELNPIERFWRDVKDRLARRAPQSLEELSALVAEILQAYTPEQISSLTSFEYLVKALPVANAQSS